MSVALISADFGRYHAPAPLPVQEGLDEAILVTDLPVELDGWNNVVADLAEEPRMASKVVKCRPDLFVDAEIVIWIDAQVHVQTATFVSYCLEHVVEHDVAVMRHPWRKSLREEAFAGHTDIRKRFEGSNLEQAEHYLAEGHPDDWYLPWTAILVRRMTPTVREFGAAWLEEQRQWTTHDQLSFGYVCRRLIGEPATLEDPEQHVVFRGYVEEKS